MSSYVSFVRRMLTSFDEDRRPSKASTPISFSGAFGQEILRVESEAPSDPTAFRGFRARGPLLQWQTRGLDDRIAVLPSSNCADA